MLSPSFLVPIDASSLFRKIERQERRKNPAPSWLSEGRLLLGAVEKLLRAMASKRHIEITDSGSSEAPGLLVVRSVDRTALSEAYSDPASRASSLLSSSGGAADGSSAAAMGGSALSRKRQLEASSDSAGAQSTTGGEEEPARKRARTEGTMDAASAASGEASGSSDGATKDANQDSSKAAAGSDSARTEKSKPDASPRKDDPLAAVLGFQSVRERELSAVGQEIDELIHKETVADRMTATKFKTATGSAIREFCPYGTKDACCAERKSATACDRVHFVMLIQPHTDRRLGDCSYLNACRHMSTCKFVHYEIDRDVKPEEIDREKELTALMQAKRKQGGLFATDLTTHTPAPANTYGSKYPAQWINCDVRTFPMDILGDFPVIMADPPWDIHMELPYGTLTDEEMLKLNIKCLQKEGVMFLWVTGRAMELGRLCLQEWGYEIRGELIWVKTNQLQRLIVTGRTGHWLNHSKEHCIIGVKGNPPLNRNLDCDVIVAEVRETSRKPDEVYGILERLIPGARKLEIFGRQHNTRPGWLTLGNQLDGTRLADPDLIAKFRERFPNEPFVQVDPKESPEESRTDANVVNGTSSSSSSTVPAGSSKLGAAS